MKDETQNGIPQTGYIHEQRPSDYLAGTLPYQERMPSADWKDFLPEGEQQNNPFVFDSMSCTTFSLMNSIETQLSQMTLSPAFKKFLTDNGYFKNGKINFSDKFIAMMSNTTKNGNSYIRVADSIKAFGLIPDTMLPFKNETTFEQWHDKKQITQAMLDLGQKFLKFVSLGYEWVIESNDDGKIDKDEKKTLEYELKHAPLNIAIPKPATHAILMPSYYNVFDSYSPYYKEGTKKIHYAFKFVVNESAIASPAFSSAVEHVLKWEGGYINDPNDPGGKTKFGISDRRDGKTDGLVDLDNDGDGDIKVENITIEQARDIYKLAYWDALKGDKMPAVVSFCVFDMAVNMGVKVAAMAIQESAGVKADGIVGNITLAAINSANPEELIKKLTVNRVRRYAALSNWQTFGLGWTNRAIDTLTEALKLKK